MQFKRILLGAFLALAMAFAGAASAQLDIPPEDPPTGEFRVYFVSAVLKKTGTADMIKLVNSVQSAVSARQSAAAFEGSIRKDFPDYSVVTMLVTPGADIRLPDCKPDKRGADRQDRVNQLPAAKERSGYVLIQYQGT